jgi:hypothetical protein
LRRKTGSVDWWNRAAQEPRGVGSGERSGMTVS